MGKLSSGNKSNLVPPVFFFVISIIFTLPFLLKLSWIGVGDWELFVTIAGVTQKSVTYFGQFPFWNPYIGGGNILFHHPEVGILTPFYILILIFGPVVGIKLQMLLCYFLGFYGTYLLARKLGQSNIASYMTSFAFFGSSYFALHFAIGHVPFTHFCYLPWFVYFLLKANDNWKFIFGSSAALALTILGNGAAVPFLYICFFGGVFILLYSFEQKNYKLLKRYVLAVVLGLLLAAVKFIPMYIYLSNNKWEGMTTDATPFGFLFKAFFSFNQGIFDTVKTDTHWGWHEYSSFISPVVIFLAIYALIKSFKKNRIWLIIGLFFFIFGLGHFADISLWSLITSLPGFSSIRSPARAFQFVILAVAVLSGFGLDELINKYKKMPALVKYLPVTLIIVVVGVNFGVNLPAMNSIAYKKPEKEVFAKNFRQIIGNKFDIYKNFRLNRGSLSAPWLSAYKESRGIVTPDNKVLMEYITQGQADIMSREYTPNEITYNLRGASPGMIVFGMGYDKGWYSDDGRPLVEQQGLISTRFNNGENKIILKYRTPYFYPGLIISLITLIFILLAGLNSDFGKRLKAVFD